MAKPKPFKFDSDNNLYAYSVEGLIELCRPQEVENNGNNEDDQRQIDKAYERIRKRDIEKWLFDIGENELSDLVRKKRKELNIIEENDPEKKDRVNKVCQALSEKINNRKFFDLLDINRAIDTTLKEYEALRAEVLQNISDINQIILLGLAAIFTIASIGLAPLSDFLTAEDTTIQMPLNMENITETMPEDVIKLFNEINVIKQGFNKELNFREFTESVRGEIEKKIEEDPTLKKRLEGELDLESAKVIIVGTSNEVEYYLKITRATNGQTIEERGIVPSIIIFNFLIPVLSLLLMSRSFLLTRKSKMIGEYIYNRVEQKLVNLSVLKKEYLGIEDKHITLPYENSNYFSTNSDNYKYHLTHIAWENYIAARGPGYSDPFSTDLIFYLFTLISFISFLGGTGLLMFDFGMDDWFVSDILLFIILVICIIVIVVSEILLPNEHLKNIVSSCNEKIFENRCLFYGPFILFIFIIFYFYHIVCDWLKGVGTIQDVVEVFFLLFLPFGFYTYLTYVCLERKSKVDKLRSQQGIRKKENFREDRNDRYGGFKDVITQMWKDNTGTEST